MIISDEDMLAYYRSSPFNEQLVQRRVFSLIGQGIVDNEHANSGFSEIHNLATEKWDENGHKAGRTWTQHLAMNLNMEVEGLNLSSEGLPVENQEELLDVLLPELDNNLKAMLYKKAQDVFNQETVERYIAVLNLDLRINLNKDKEENSNDSNN